MGKQLMLPGITRRGNVKFRNKPASERMIRLRTMNLEDGMNYLNNQGSRKIDGFWVESVMAKKSTRLHMFKSGQIICVKCGLMGEIFHIERHKNDSVMPFSINLYAKHRGKEVMMTWDHILPKSLGGSNHLDNAQCMCERCNSAKGNSLSLDEIVAIVQHPNAINMNRIPEVECKLKIQDIIKEARRDLVSEIPINNTF